MPKKKAASPDKGKAPSSGGRESKAKVSFPIVAIGASAGGLEALEEFLSQVPTKPGMAFVVIQHLAPAHKSVMDSLLKKFTDLDILVIEDGMRVKPDHVYLNPADKEVAIVKGVLHLIEPEDSVRVRLPIDYFFRSLAEDHGERAVCVVLSGTGSDGTLGLKAVKEAGGMAMVQDKEEARYDGMPSSAIATGLVDFILPAAGMAAELINYARHPYVKSPGGAAAVEDESRAALQKIFHLIRRQTGHDFSDYKLSTIRRRVERRMAVHQVDRVENYLKFLQQNPDEVDALYRDMLITVTNFFRDPAAFKALKEKVLREIVEKKPDESNIRVWAVGCATGEEAYSLAMALLEAAEEAGKHFSYQIFATDIDSEAIEKARAGVYPQNIAADVPRERLDRFFAREGKRYKIKKQVRDMVVFAVQNIINDPPFSKLDLVSCRNLLIYMTPVLQKKLMPLFFYTLNPGGFLFLGTSESIGEFSDLFSLVDQKWKIFKKKADVSEKKVEFHAVPAFAHRGARHEAGRKPPTETDIRHLAEKVILNEYGPPCVLVNERYEIVYFQGNTERFLTPPVGEPSFNILQMARDEIRYKLGTALHKAVIQKKAVVASGLSVKHDSALLGLDLKVRPVVEPSSGATLVMVVFDAEKVEAAGGEEREKKKKGPSKEKEAAPRIAELEQELQSTREHLQTTIEELETSSEELKSTNEELQSTNEELQSANEELETSREELQSANEELETVNTELQSKIEQLSSANDDLNNLLASTDIATIFLDTALRIKRFTPAANRIYSLIESDKGRSIGDIKPRVEYDYISEDSKEVLDRLERKEREIRGDASWYSVRILPYRTVENVIDGVVVTFFDITDSKKAEEKTRAAFEYVDGVLETVREPLLILDQNLTVLSANRSFYRTFRVVRADTEGKRVYDLGNRQWNIPALRELLEDIIPENTAFDDFEVEHVFPDIGRKRMFLNARKIEQKEESPARILLAMEDVTGENRRGGGEAG